MKNTISMQDACLLMAPPSTVPVRWTHKAGRPPEMLTGPERTLADYGGVPPWWRRRGDGPFQEWASLRQEWEAGLRAASAAAAEIFRRAIDSGEICPPTPAPGRVVRYEGLPYRAGRGTTIVYGVVHLASGLIADIRIYSDVRDDI